MRETSKIPLGSGALYGVLAVLTMFGAYALGYGGTYASLGPSGGYGDGYGSIGQSVSPAVCPLQSRLRCFEQQRSLERQTVEPNDTQRAVLDEIKDATARALDILKAGRIEAMRQRLAMLQAVRTIRPVVEKFYQSLNDEQKARFNALSPDNPDQQQVQRNLTQVCGERASGIASLPLERIERAVQPDDGQRSAFKDTPGSRPMPISRAVGCSLISRGLDAGAPVAVILAELLQTRIHCRYRYFVAMRSRAETRYRCL